MKRYIVYTIKRNIPLFAITFAICFSTFLSVYSALPPTLTSYGYDYGAAAVDAFAEGEVYAILISSAVILFLMSSILPLFANSYRYSLKSADVFYQIGKGKRSIRFVNNFIVLIAFIVSFSVAFLFGVTVALVKQLPNYGKYPLINDTNETITYYLFFNYLYMIPVYLLYIVIGVLNYFISYFLVTRSNNPFNSIITLLLGQAILGVGLMTPFWLINILAASSGNSGIYIISESFVPASRTMGMVSPLAYIICLFAPLIAHNTINPAMFTISEASFNEIFGVVMSILSLVLFFLISAYSVYKFFKEEESSGEYCGRAFGRDKLQYIIFHIGFGIIGLWVIMLQSSFSSILIYEFISTIVLLISEVIFLAALYYVFLGILRRNFRINLKGLLIIIVSLSINVTIGLSNIITRYVSLR